MSTARLVRRCSDVRTFFELSGLASPPGRPYHAPYRRSRSQFRRCKLTERRRTRRAISPAMPRAVSDNVVGSGTDDVVEEDNDVGRLSHRPMPSDAKYFATIRRRYAMSIAPVLPSTTYGTHAPCGSNDGPSAENA